MRNALLGNQLITRKDKGTTAAGQARLEGLCPPVPGRALAPRQETQTQTHTKKHRHGHTQRHTHKNKTENMFTLRDGPGPASIVVEAPIPHCGTAGPGQPHPFSSCRRTCLVSFDLLPSHGSGSAQNLSVTASEINSRNSGICFCNGNHYSKPRNLYLQQGL